MRLITIYGMLLDGEVQLITLIPGVETDEIELYTTVSGTLKDGQRALLFYRVPISSFQKLSSWEKHSWGQQPYPGYVQAFMGAQLLFF